MVEFVLNKAQPSFILYCKINGAIFDVYYESNHHITLWKSNLNVPA